MDELNKYCRQQDPALPEGWQVYAIECLPKDAETATHIKLVGSVCRIISRGPRKGKKTWTPKVGKREFIVSVEEFERLMKRKGE